MEKQTDRSFKKALVILKDQYGKWSKYRTPFSSLDSMLAQLAIVELLEEISAKLDKLQCHCQEEKGE